MIRPADREYCHGLRAVLEKDLHWVEQEPCAEPLWDSVRTTVKRLLTQEWQQGLIDGRSADEAFYVRCGRETMTADDITQGRLIVDIGVAFGSPPAYYTMQLQLRTRRLRTS